MLVEEERPKKKSALPPPPAIVKRIDDEWPALRGTLFRIAMRRCRGNEAHAEDLVADTYIAIRIGRHRWTPPPELLEFGGSVLNCLAANRNRSAANRREVLDDGADSEEMDHAPISQNPERLVIEKDEASRWTKINAALASQFDPNDRVHEYLALIQAGITVRAEIATRLGLDVEQVKYLRKRVRDAFAKLAEETE